ncbi:MAG: PhzF family phenazine biosynthesis protein, partial [Fimbriimonas ginsengisoli]|nr:PhzF family phenazine biosynthesis protein [Fimbriimonas ginsengisoli]
MPLPITVVDAFASEPFGGNPAAVCVLAEPADPEWMQRVAAEMNLSETAFLLAQAGGAWHLRWFTPSVEVDLCGHATLASAHVLWESGRLRHDQPAELDTKSGRLVCRLDGGWIRMDFPAKPVSAAPVPAGLK